LVLFLIPLQFVHLFCNQSKCSLLFFSCISSLFADPIFEPGYLWLRQADYETVTEGMFCLWFYKPMAVLFRRNKNHALACLGRSANTIESSLSETGSFCTLGSSITRLWRAVCSRHGVPNTV
jgi:hypothetical protein